MQKKAFCTLLLAVCFALGMLVFPVSAATDSVDTWKWSFDSSTATLTISGTGTVTGFPPGSGEGYMKYVADIRHLVIEEGITEIGQLSFSQTLYNLESIRIADSVETIGNMAFANNFRVTQLHLGKGIRTIGEAAFTTLQKLESLTLPSRVQSIGLEAFSLCGMKELIIPDGITVIENSAFRSCENLTCVYIPVGVTQIEYAAFRDCDKITDVYFGGTEAQWKAIDIDQTVDGKGGSNTALLTATIHYNHTDAWETGAPNTQPDTSTEPTISTQPTTPTQPAVPTQPTIPTQPENEPDATAAPTEEQKPAETDPAATQPIEDAGGEEEPASLPWVAIGIGAVAVIAVGSVVMWLRVRKKP